MEGRGRGQEQMGGVVGGGMRSGGAGVECARVEGGGGWWAKGLEVVGWRRYVG